MRNNNGLMSRLDRCDQTHSPCLANEVCSVDVSTGEPSCTCLDGFTGPNCTVNQNDCTASASQCLNGATCYDKVDGVQCVCALGYSGRNCELDARDCIFDICDGNNTQSCNDTGNNFRCICVIGWIGDFCESVDPNTTPLPTSISPPSSSFIPSSSSSISASSVTLIASSPNSPGLNETGK